jgi:hypothetical protein
LRLISIATSNIFIEEWLLIQGDYIVIAILGYDYDGNCVKLKVEYEPIKEKTFNNLIE